MHFDVLYLLENVELPLLECKNITSAAVINKLKYAEIANFEDLEDVTPENCTFCHLIFDIWCSQIVIM